MRKKTGFLIKEYLCLPGSKASILVLTLWTLVLLSIFSLYLGRAVRQKAALARSLSFRASLREIAASGVKKAAVELLGNDPGVDSLKDSWSNNPAAFEEFRVGLGACSIYYYYTDSGGFTNRRYGLLDEQRKININTADRFVLARLIENAAGAHESTAREVAAAIIDWRDADSEASSPVGGAEDRYYTGLSEPYNCKNADFEAPEELLLVKGVDHALYERLVDFVTIHGSGKININTASRTVLKSLGIDDSVIDKIIDFRAGDDGVEGTFDDRIFLSASGIPGQLSQHFSLSSSELASISNAVAAGHFSVSSEYFTVKVTASLGTQKKEARYVINRQGEIAAWREL